MNTTRDSALTPQSIVADYFRSRNDIDNEALLELMDKWEAAGVYFESVCALFEVLCERVDGLWEVMESATMSSIGSVDPDVYESTAAGCRRGMEWLAFTKGKS